MNNKQDHLPIICDVKKKKVYVHEYKLRWLRFTEIYETIRIKTSVSFLFRYEIK